HTHGLIPIDFECAHAGDAAFDLGFFLSHLILKTIHKSWRLPTVRDRYVDLIGHFWSAYRRRIDSSRWRPSGPEPRALPPAAACLLARVGGTRPVAELALGV